MYNISRKDMEFLKEESKQFLTKNLHWAVDVLFDSLKELKKNNFLSKPINLPYFSSYKGDPKKLYSSVDSYAKKNNFIKNGNYFNIDSITKRESIEFQYAEPPVQVSYLFEPPQYKGGGFRLTLSVKPSTFIFDSEGNYAKDYIDDELINLIKKTQGVDITKYEESLFLLSKGDSFKEHIAKRFKEVSRDDQEDILNLELDITNLKKDLLDAEGEDKESIKQDIEDLKQRIQDIKDAAE